jgi:hypothetical protein
MLALAVGASPAAAQEPTGWTAPAYPGNTLTIAHDGPIVAGTVVRVRMSGHAEWGEPTDDLTTPFDLYLFVQNPDIEPACAPSYGSQLQMGINIDLNASASISGWVMEGDLHVNPAAPASGIDWAGDSVPFAVKPGLDRVLLCGFQRYIIDDVAGFQLPVRVEQPRCRAKRSAIRRKRGLALECNVSGPATVRFRGPRSRTVAVRLSTEDGTVTGTELLRSAPGKGVLLDFSARRPTHLRWLARLWADRVSTVVAEPDPEGPLDGTAAALVRPDGYIAWAASADEATRGGLEDEARAALRRWFGPPEPGL